MKILRDSEGKFINGGTGYWKGKKLLKSAIKKKSEIMLGKTGQLSPRWKGGLPKCKECNKKLSTYKSKTGYCKKCGSKIFRGNKAPNYKDGRCSSKDYMSWIKNKRNRMLRVAKGSHTFKEWQELKKKCNYTCQTCNRKEPKIKLTEDHIIPVSKNGNDYIENIQPLCQSCNSKKNNNITIC